MLLRTASAYRNGCRCISTTVVADGLNALVRSVKDVRTSQWQTGEIANEKIVVKDNICTKDFPTTCASQMLQNFRPSYNATVVDLLESAGAVIIAKANCDEFGMGSSNIYSSHGPVINPWDTSSMRTAGGSSGGSAAAVAANMCFGALGTDTGGSVRLPAAYCGVVGFKPSYGLLSRHGVIAYSDSLDCVGILARSVENVKRLFRVLNFYDPHDPTSVSMECRHAASNLARAGIKRDNPLTLEDIRIGIPQEYFPLELGESVRRVFRRVLEFLKRQQAPLLPLSLPNLPFALSSYYVIASAEASSNLARYNGVRLGMCAAPSTSHDPKSPSSVFAETRSRYLGPEVKRRILLGTHALTAEAFDNYFLQAQTVRRMIQNDFDSVFAMPNLRRKAHPEELSGSAHVLLHPSSITTAPCLEPEFRSHDRLDAYVQDMLTVPASLAGLPAISIPCGTGDDGWPVGITLEGQWGSDELILEVAGLITEALATSHE